MQEGISFPPLTMTTTQLVILAGLLLIAGFLVFIIREFTTFLAEDRAQRRANIPQWTVAAESGDVDAQLTLAWEYARGDAVEQDIRAAWNWFERAAMSGQEEARVHRARFLQLRWVPEGVRELRELARKGNWKAQFWLGRYHQSLRGRFNQLRSVVWYDRSFRSGCQAAKLAKLGQLTRVARLPGKIAFAGKAFVAFVVAVHSIDSKIHFPLVYSLKERKPAK